MEQKRGPHVIVIGAGIGGMAAAAELAQAGCRTTVLERNDQPGGRARVWQKDGYTFDMGPSWYLMPEVFARFFAKFGRTPADFYELKQLDPSYRVFCEPGEMHDVPPDRAGVRALFDRLEPGGGAKLERYLEAAAYKYRMAVGEFLYRDYRSIFDFLNRRMLTEGLKLNVLGRLDAAVRRNFSDRRARQILEYAMVFLGTSPNAAPAMYALMSHVDLTQGVFYPLGGLAAVAQGVRRLAEAQGVEFRLSTEAVRIATARGAGDGRGGARARRPHGATALRRGAGERGLRARGDGAARAGGLQPAAGVLGKPRRGAEHVPDVSRREPAAGKVGAPQLAFPGRLERAFRCDLPAAGVAGESVLLRVVHHEDRSGHGAAGAGERVRAGAGGGRAGRHRRGAGGVRGKGAAPRGTDHGRRNRAARRSAADFQPPGFRGDYRAWKGTALGISHTLMQTAVFRPAMRSRKVANLYFAGQYTHPGIGVPMVLIAAEVAAGIVRHELGRPGA
jgi:phytoene desaturase